MCLQLNILEVGKSYLVWGCMLVTGVGSLRLVCSHPLLKVYSCMEYIHVYMEYISIIAWGLAFCNLGLHWPLCLASLSDPKIYIYIYIYIEPADKSNPVKN